jgi:hypothetical protein
MRATVTGSARSHNPHTRSQSTASRPSPHQRSLGAATAGRPENPPPGDAARHGAVDAANGWSRMDPTRHPIPLWALEMPQSVPQRTPEWCRGFSVAQGESGRGPRASFDHTRGRTGSLKCPTRPEWTHTTCLPPRVADKKPLGGVAATRGLGRDAGVPIVLRDRHRRSHRCRRS